MVSFVHPHSQAEPIRSKAGFRACQNAGNLSDISDPTDGESPLPSEVRNLPAFLQPNVSVAGVAGFEPESSRNRAPAERRPRD